MKIYKIIKLVSYKHIGDLNRINKSKINKILLLKTKIKYNN